jgi:hypothetical protein
MYRFFYVLKYNDLPITDVVEIQAIVIWQCKSGFRLGRDSGIGDPIKKPNIMIFFFGLIIFDFDILPVRNFL